MAQKVGTVTSELILDTRKASQAYKRFEQTVARGRGRDNFMSGISADAKDFDNSLGKATNRVVAFGAAAAVFNTLAKAASAFAESVVDVDNSLAKINVNLGQSTEGLRKFGADLFNIARQTGQTFEVTAKAAEELARQGLGAEETTKRLKDALILSRIAGLDSADAVETLTAAINSFNAEALTSTEVINKFAAVDTKFAVSSKDLAEAVSRVGSTAQSAGVGINELIGLVTSLQQTTARGGATIGNGLKTIFTRIQSAPETINALQSIGVAIKNTDGSLRDAISILRDYSAAREKVGEVERASLDRTVAGTFQINILKAALADLGKEYSVYNNAVKTSAGATDEAIRKNEQLNETLASLINGTGQSIKQFFASVGDQKLSGGFQDILKNFEKARAFFSGDSGDELGKSLGDGILKGISNVLSGPALVALFFVLGKAFSKVAVTIAAEARTLLTINNSVAVRANIQKQINSLLQQATDTERAQYAAASSVLAKKEAILAIVARTNQEELAGSQVARSFQVRGVLGQAVSKDIRRGNSYGIPKYPIFADPIASAISREKAAGAPAGQIYVDRDARVASFANPMGILVANRRDEPLGGYQGVNRVLSQGGNPKMSGITPNFARDTQGADDLNKFFKLIGGKVGTDFREANRERIAKGESVTFTKPAAIKLAKLDPYYITRENPDGSLTVIKILTDKEVAKKLGASKKVSIPTSLGVHKTSTLSKVTGAVGQIGSQISLDRPRDAKGKFISYEQADRITRNNAIVGNAERYSEFSAFNIGSSERASRQRLGHQQKQDAYISNIDPFASSASNIRIAEFRANRNKQKKAEAQAKIDAAETKRLSGIEERSKRNQNISLAASFALPFAAGFIPEGQGGTGKGQLLGAASGALNGAGIGGIFGLPGLAGGAVIGALIGGFSKATKSLEEFNTEIENATVVQNKIVESAISIRNIDSQLSDIKSQGGSKEVINRLSGQRLSALQQVSDPTVRARLSKGFGSDQEAADFYEKLQETASQKASVGGFSQRSRTQSEDTIQTKFGKLLQQPEKLFGKFGSAIVSGPVFSALTSIGRANEREGNNKVNLSEVARDRRELAAALLPALNQDNVGKINTKGLQIGNETATGTQIKRLQTIFDDLGASVEITDRNYRENAEALLDSTKSFRALKTEVDKQKTAASGRLASGSFLNRPNLDVFGQAAFTGRDQNANRGQKSQAQFDAFQELSGAGAVGFDATNLKSNSLYQKASAGVQSNNIADILIRLLQNNNPSVGSLRDSRGNPNLDSIQRSLEFVANSGIENAAFFKEFLKFIPQLQKTMSDAKVTTIGSPLTNGPNFSSGFTPGANYGEFTKSLKRGGAGYNVAPAGRGRSDDTRYITSDMLNRNPFAGNKSGFNIVQGHNPDTPAGAAGQYDDKQRRDKDIAAWQKIVDDQKEMASTLEKLFAEGLNIAVNVNGGGDSERSAQIQAAIQDIYDRQAAAAGKPNPPRRQPNVLPAGAVGNRMQPFE